MLRVKKNISDLSQVAMPLTWSAFETWHGRFTLVGLSIGLVYFPTWLSQLFHRSFVHGSTALTIILIIVSLGIWQIFSKRSQLASLPVLEADQTIGHLLILSSLLLFPFCRFAVWPQAILWLIVLVGLAFSTWGGQFFIRYPLITLLFAATVYPKPGILAHTLWQALTPYQFLERLMAQAGAVGLRLIGQAAIAEGSYLAIPPAGAVNVDWGCNGFTMAVQMAIAGFLIGIFLKQNWLNMTIMVVVGAALALVFNVPRIMLLTLASVYWGDGWFDFWHGTWGGQIFTGLLFTLYYYAIMWMVNRRPKKVA